MKYRIAAAACLAAIAAGCSSHEEAEDSTKAATNVTLAGAESCTGDKLGGLDGSASWVEAADGVPAYCEIKATLHPVEGSAIGVVYRLPADWNGKVLGIGGGGWAGNVTLDAARESLHKGYATFQTDGGHSGTGPWDNSWAENAAAAEDFSHRAVHEMTVVGKRLVATVYGQQPDRAYFQGCSTGGRMALMEAQRYPEDYDAISAGAPVYTLQVQTSAVLRNNIFSDAKGFTPADLKLAQSSALASCDAADGLKDGLINDPRQCQWDPAEIQCSGAKNASCLSGDQVTALRKAYAGVKSSDGQWAAFPLSRGGETGWQMYMATDGSGKDPTGGGGLISLAAILFGKDTFDWRHLSADKDVPKIRSSDFAKMYEAKNPDLSAFFGRGGKLIVWHGENDGGPSPVGTSDYVQSVRKTTPQAADDMRFFLLPGVEHCRGGPGADQVQWLDTLDAWASGGKAPEQVVGTKQDGSLTRLHCASPKVAHYKGDGEPNDPANWQCVAPKSTATS